jgi:hypothetical protein
MTLVADILLWVVLVGIWVGIIHTLWMVYRDR